jgi:hypothetical protein
MPLIGYKQTKKHIKKAALGKVGGHRSEKTKIKMSLWQRGEKSPRWKGKEAGYKAIHKWINENFGRPKKCEFCKKGGLIGKHIHWANISKKYERERGDWIRLCQKCHSNITKEMGEKHSQI